MLTMKLSIVTSFATLKYSLEETIRIVGELGYDGVDIAAWWPHADPDAMDAVRRREVKELMNAHGLEAGALATVGLGIADTSLTVREATVQYDMKCLDLAADLGYSRVEMLGGWMWRMLGIPFEKTWEITVQNFKRVSEHAEDVGVMLAMEFEPSLPLIPHDLNQLKRFIDEVGSEYCRANLDIGHCNIRSANVTEEQIRALKGYIVHTHINDNNGETDANWLPGLGTTPYEQILRILDEMGYEGYLAVELEAAPRPVEWARQAKTYLEDLLEETGYR